MNEQELKLLESIKTDIDRRNYFFQKVESPRWFLPLSEAGFFNSSSIPEQDETGYLRDWEILPYLERLSKQHSSGATNIPIKEILQIIKDTTKECENNPKKYNYRIWWYFVKILSNIDPNIITYDHLELIRIWLNNPFKQLLPSAEIATAFLPKFINATHIKKAEKIIDIITDIKWVERTNWEEKSAQLSIEPYWLTESLVKKENAIKIGKICSIDFIKLISCKFQDYLVVKYKSDWFDKEDGDIVFRVIMELEDINTCQCSIVSIPKETVKKEMFFSRNLRPAGHTTILEPVRLSTKVSVDDLVLKIEPILSKLPNMKQPIKDEILNSFIQLLRNVFHDHSYIWFKNFRTGKKFFSDQAERTLVGILIDFIIGKADQDKESTLKIFELFQSQEFPYPIFKRFIYHVLSKNWVAYNPVFWEMFEKYGAEELFDNPNYNTDIHALLIENIERFKKEKKKILLKTIESGPWNYQVYEDGFDRTNTWRQSWYASLKADSFFQSYYKKYFNLTQVKETDVFSEGEVTYGPGPSPKPLEELIKLPEKELIKFLKDYKSEKTWKGPNVNGLSNQLTGLFRDNPEKIAESGESYQKVPYVHMYHIFWGLKDACENKKDIRWKRIFWIMEDYIGTQEFWSDAWSRNDDDWNADKKWVIEQICDLLSSGSKSNSFSFPIEDIVEAEKILKIIIEHADELRPQNRDEEGIGLNYALNSSMGKTVKALFDISLLHARQVKDDSSQTKWLQNLKDKYEWLLDNKIVEAYTYLGAYLPNFYFLEKSWAVSNTDRMLEIQDEKLWSAFFEGYLYIARIYPNVFKTMRPHYQKALETAASEDDDKRRLVEHIGVAYIQGFEELDGSLFSTIIDSWNYEWIRELIQLFWRHKGIKEGSFPERILSFWKVCFEKLNNIEIGQEDKKILDELSRLACFIPELTQEYFEWLKLSIIHVETQFNYTYIIEHLDELKIKGERVETARFTAKLFLQMLEKLTPDYKEDNIRSILIHLYETPDQEVKMLTNEICEKYGRRGVWRICRDLFEKYNPELKRN